MVRLTAVAFAVGGAVHATALILLAWGIALYGEDYPAWRHFVMAAVDWSVAALAVWRKPWLLVALPAFMAEQLLVNGLGLTPLLVLAAWIGVGSSLASQRKEHNRSR